ncbi:contractile injection system tape measure protein [Tenacibaculum sp. 190524A05c]|uniref:contractile injection system tape measure protein n=1 Tax=Tenacibaculum platacis TaxID=3137852 RepID=UPI0031FB950C
MRIQEHIINKVVVDINTNTKKVANELKNSIDTFLKEEVFPLLESFFESNSTDDIIKRIPKLSLDIDVNAKDFSLTSEIAKRDFKKKISDQLKEIMSQPEVHDIEVVESSREKTKADTFFEFLESGTLSWWNNPSNNFSFSKRDIFEITETSNFSFRFLKVLQTPSQKVRLFNQFFDEELHLLFLGISNTSLALSEVQQELSNTNVFGTNSEIRKELWICFSEAIVRKDDSIFFELAVQMIHEKENQRETATVKTLKEFLHDITSSNIEILRSLSIEIKQQLEELVSHSFIENNENETHETNQKLSDKIQDIQGQVDSDLAKNQIILPKESQLDFTSKANGKLSEENHLIDTENARNTNHTESNGQDENQENQEFSATENSVHDVSNESKITANVNLTSNKENTNLDIDERNSSSEVSSKSEPNKINDESHLKNVQNVQLNKKENRNNNSYQTSEIQSTKGENSYQSENVNLDDEIQKKKQFESYQKEHNREVKRSQRSEEQDKLQKQKLSELKNIKELFKGFNKPKSYIIKNAGLILIHPFLKQFFASCNLLNDKNEIIKPTEAVHLLHYVATKREKQLESNLIFEKFLCNVPIHQTIERNITLSDELKENAENLLQSIVQNWEILKNSSSDLIRNEFIQRQGKLDLTKDNPHITIERKTQDILLDKLPWNYSLCKLPWMKTLLFTDW